jgi:hypothetical protein
MQGLLVTSRKCNSSPWPSGAEHRRAQLRPSAARESGRRPHAEPDAAKQTRCDVRRHYPRVTIRNGSGPNQRDLPRG